MRLFQWKALWGPQTMCTTTRVQTERRTTLQWYVRRASARHATLVYLETRLGKRFWLDRLCLPSLVLDGWHSIGASNGVLDAPTRLARTRTSVALHARAASIRRRRNSISSFGPARASRETASNRPSFPREDFCDWVNRDFGATREFFLCPGPIELHQNGFRTYANCRIWGGLLAVSSIKPYD